MKVAVITLKDSPNYGGILQAYAMQKTIQKLGHECVLIDYMNDEFRHKFTFFGRPTGMGVVYWLFKKVQYPLMTVMMKRLMPFYGYMDLTKHFDKPEDLKELNKDYDIFVTGSDQVWACDLNFKDDSYFLSFAEEGKRKVAYAASFGRTIDMMSEAEKDFIRPQLDRFDFLGVREDSGVEVVKSLSGRSDAVPVLDPTLLLNPEDWEKVASHAHKGKGKKYILCYLMQSRTNDSEALRAAKEMSRKTGMTIIKICRGLTSILWGETAYVPSVEEWLGLFMDAEYIFTNSFHGMAFSVNFHKNFTVFLEGDPMSGRNSRIYDRCKDFGLMNRVKIVKQDIETNTDEIDYMAISKKVEMYRYSSRKWLEKSLMI